MPVVQTIAEMGLEREALALWSEPRFGQGLKPKFGSRPFPKKLLYAVLILFSYVAYVVWTSGRSIPVSVAVLVPIVLVALAWPLAIALDRLNRRNVWIYPNRIVVSHARDRIVLLKSGLSKVFVYRLEKHATVAIEFLSSKGKSIVVAVPSEVPVSDLISTLSNLGYPVENDL